MLPIHAWILIEASSPSCVGKHETVFKSFGLQGSNKWATELTVHNLISAVLGYFPEASVYRNVTQIPRRHQSTSHACCSCDLLLTNSNFIRQRILRFLEERRGELESQWLQISVKNTLDEKIFRWLDSWTTWYLFFMSENQSTPNW